MLAIHIPPDENLRLEHLCLDLNGTLTCNGKLIPGVAERLEILKDKLDIHVITADTYGNAAAILEGLPVSVNVIAENRQGETKRDIVRGLGASVTAGIGNGYNDRFMLATCALSIAVIEGEGCSKNAVEAARITTRSINDALDMLIYPKRVTATLRD